MRSDFNKSALRLIYAGCSDHAFRRRSLVVLQAYFDDSRKQLGRPQLFLAGFVNTADHWLEFSNEWSDVLRSSPSIDYFKSTEAQHMRGQFKGWGRLDRDLKVMALAGIISRFKHWSFHVSIDVIDFKSAVDRNGVPWGFRNEYWLAFEAILIKVSQRHKELGIDGPVDFIFDNQNQIHRSAASLYECIVEAQQEDIKHLFGAPPVFRDDKEVEALQAADMLAWHVQKDTRDGELIPRRPVTKEIVQSGAHAYTHMNRSVLDQIGDGLSGIGNLANVSTKKQWREVLDAIDRESAALKDRR